jgi:hypothetical protein
MRKISIIAILKEEAWAIADEYWHSPVNDKKDRISL